MCRRRKKVREIVQHLFTNIVKPARSKRDSRQAKTHVDNLLLQLVDDMLSVWNTDSFLDRAQELVKKSIDKHAKYNITELHKLRRKGKRRAADSRGADWRGGGRHGGIRGSGKWA